MALPGTPCCALRYFVGRKRIFRYIQDAEVSHQEFFYVNLSFLTQWDCYITLAARFRKNYALSSKNIPMQISCHYFYQYADLFTDDQECVAKDSARWILDALMLFHTIFFYILQSQK